MFCQGSLAIQSKLNPALKSFGFKPYHNLNRDFLSNYEKGISAEACAERELKLKGYEILGRRVRTKYGEIDILAKKDRDIVAVEVKQRRTLNDSRACISIRQQKRIVNALLFVLSEMNESFESYRIDVICLDSVGRFEHIENAFPIEDLVAC